MASLLRATLLGGIDGVVTSYAVVAGSHTVELSTDALLVVSFSSLIADAVSMGISEFLSSTGERAARKTSEGTRPFFLGMACFLSFVLFGVLPILTYVWTAGKLLTVTIFSIVEMMILGSARTLISDESVLYGLFQTTILGSVAGATAYGVAVLTRSYVSSP